jgi:hypothetical protein
MGKNRYMDWKTAVEMIAQSTSVAKFTYDGEQLTAMQQQELNHLCLYFTHAVSIILTKKTLFNCLVVKKESGTVLTGDGSVTGDSSLALLCCLEGVHNIAELNKLDFKAGDQVDIKPTIDLWSRFINSVDLNTVIDCKRFTSTIMNELVSDISHKAVLYEPENVTFKP